MNRITRFLSGGLLGASLVGAFLAFSPTDAWARFDIKVGCSGNICCTYDDQTGAIYSCVLVNVPD